MAFSETLRLLVSADTKGAVTEVEKLGKTAEREASRSKDRLDKLGNGLTKAGTGMIAFGAVTLGAMGHAAMAYEEARLSELKLENTLKNAPKLAGENKKQFIDLANAIQDKTAADADAIVEGEALLGTFQLTAKEIRGITPLAVDYARKFGIGIPEASVQVGKALDGQVGALKRNGVSIDEALYKTDRYAAVTKALREQVGGFSEAEGKTFAGSLQRLKNQLGDIEEGVGKGAVDAFTGLFGVVGGLSNKLKDLSPNAQETIGKVATYGSVALIAAGATSTLIGQVVKARDNFKTAWEAVNSLRSGLSGTLGSVTRFGLAIGTLAAVGQAIDELSGGIKGLNISKLENDLLRLAQTGKASSDLLDAAGGDLDRLKDAVERIAAPSIGTQIHNVGEEISTLGGALGETGHDLEEDKRLIDDFDKALARLAGRNPKLAREALKQLTDQMDPKEADRFVGLLDDYDAALADIDTTKATSGTQDFTGALEDQGTATADAKSEMQQYTDELQNYSDKLDAMTDPIFGAVDALHGVRDAQLAYQDAQVKVLESQVALDTAIRDHGDTSAEAAEATRNLQDAQRELNDAQWNTVESASEADGALATLRQAVDNGDISVAQFRATLQTWVDQGFLTQQQAERAAGGLRGLGDEADIADRKRVDIPANLNGAPAVRRKIREIKDDIQNLDGKTATVHVKVVATGENQIAIMEGKLLGPGRARGGQVFADRMYPVAEGGKSELLRMGSDTFLIPGRDGYVIPANDYGMAAGALGSAGNGGTMRVVVEDNRVGVYINDKQIAESVNRHNKINYGRSSIRVRG